MILYLYMMMATFFFMLKPNKVLNVGIMCLMMILIFSTVMFLEELKLSFLFMFLTVWIIVSMFFSHFQYGFTKNKHLAASMMLLGMLLLTLFNLSEFFLFYLIYEVIIIPTFVLIIFYGTSKYRWEASIFFIVFTLLTSLFLLVSMMFLLKDGINFKFGYSSLNIMSISSFNFLFQFFFIFTFLAKFPVFFLHLWLPKAHVEAPVMGSMILAGVLLKLGGWGIFLLNQNNFFSSIFLNCIIYFVLIGSVYMGYICYRQNDIKILIAFSSVNHMGVCLIGLFMNYHFMLYGAVMIMLGHGFISSLMFFMASVNYSWSGQRSLNNLSAVGLSSLSLAIIWVFSVMMSVGFPPFPNFMGELYIMINIVMIQPLIIIMLVNFFINLLYSITLLSNVLHKKHVKIMLSPQKSSIYTTVLVAYLHLYPFLLLMNFNFIFVI